MSVDSAGVVSGVNQVSTYVEQLNAKMQDFGKRADAIWGNLASAPRVVQQQFAFLNSEAAKLTSNTVAVSQEMLRLNTAMLDAEQSAEKTAGAIAQIGEASERTVPQMAAASAAVRLLEGNTTGSIRAAERFLSTTLNLGPALQAAFPVFGALAFLGVIEHVADVTSKFFADIFVFDSQAKAAYASQVASNQQLAAAVDQLRQSEANLFTTTHTTEQNIQHDIDTDIDKRTQLTQKITDQQAAIDKLKQQEQSELSVSPNFQGRGYGTYNLDQAAQATDPALASRMADANTQLRALQNQAKATDDNIAADYQRLNDKEDEIDQQRLQKAQQNAEKMQEINAQGARETLKLYEDQNKQLDEMDQLFNKEQNEMFKETNQENDAALKQRGADLDKELKDEQRQYQQNEREFQRYTNQLSNDLYQAFNEMTSGNIGTLIMDGFKRLFANILAQWIATVQGIGNVSTSSTRGGATGLFGALLGSLLGIGGTPAGGGATGPYGLPAGVASSFDDSGMMLPGGTDILGGSLPSISVSPGGSIAGAVLSAGVGTAGAAQQQQQQRSGIGGILSNIGSFGSLQKLAPLGLLGALLLGSKGGNSAIAGGALIGALGLGALYGPSTAATAAVAPFAGLLGPLAGGLIGFGVGSATGSPLAGGLSGAGSGALIGLLAGGPIGAAIGGIIGGLAGLFGGLFGGGPSKHSQADTWIQQNVLPQINQEVNAYEGFQTDFATAMNDLETLKTNSFNSLHQQFGKDAATDEWNRLVVPAVGTAEKTIQDFQNQRNQRGSINFGLPQFADGGAVLAVVHEGEHVMTRAATQRYGHSFFDSLNSSARNSGQVRGSYSATPITLNVQTMDAASFRSWLRSGAIQEIGASLQRDYMGGR